MKTVVESRSLVSPQVILCFTTMLCRAVKKQFCIANVKNITNIHFTLLVHKSSATKIIQRVSIQVIRGRTGYTYACERLPATSIRNLKIHAKNMIEVGKSTMPDPQFNIIYAHALSDCIFYDLIVIGAENWKPTHMIYTCSERVVLTIQKAKMVKE